jgi:glutathione peroxidase-family protein
MKTLRFGIVLTLTLVQWMTWGQNGYNVGDRVADFKLKNTNDQWVSLYQYEPASKGAIVVITCNHCPFSRRYEERLVTLDKKYAGQGFPVIAVNPSDPDTYEEDSFENMKIRAKEQGFTFPYLVDATQQVGRRFGAERTPTVFVLKREGDLLTVQYIGAIDNNAQDPAGVSKRYVEEALNNLLAGKPVVTNTTKSIGCAIKWKDAR